MQHRVNAKQNNSKMCLVCGLKNPFGLHASFYELDNGELLAVLVPREEHQSYPGRLHGGMITAILDETIGRAMTIKDENTWGVTMELTTRYRKPVPLNEEIRVIGRIEKDTHRYFEGTGAIILKDGSVAAEAHGKYMKLALEDIADFDYEEQEWKVVPSEDDPEQVEI